MCIANMDECICIRLYIPARTILSKNDSVSKKANTEIEVAVLGMHGCVCFDAHLACFDAFHSGVMEVPLSQNKSRPLG